MKSSNSPDSPGKCMSCSEPITKDNDGIEMPQGKGESFYQCEDCHFIEYGYRISAMNLFFENIDK